jgi:DOPA 4,5-dioxygenase
MALWFTPSTALGVFRITQRFCRLCALCRKPELALYTDKNRRRCTSTLPKQEERAMAKPKGYHAHVYFDADTKPIAERLRNTIVDKFAVEPGAFSDEPRGPHPIPQFNVIFEAPEFHNIVSWLMLNREGLNVLVHPLTESNYDDHSTYALWLGTPVPLRLDRLSRKLPESLLPSAQRA